MLAGRETQEAAADVTQMWDDSKYYSGTRDEMRRLLCEVDNEAGWLSEVLEGDEEGNPVARAETLVKAADKANTRMQAIKDNNLRNGTAKTLNLARELEKNIKAAPPSSFPSSASTSSSSASP